MQGISPNGSFFFSRKILSYPTSIYTSLRAIHCLKKTLFVSFILRELSLSLSPSCDRKGVWGKPFGFPPN